MRSGQYKSRYEFAKVISLFIRNLSPYKKKMSYTNLGKTPKIN